MPFGWVAAGSAILGAVTSTSASNKQVGAENRATDIANQQYEETRSDEAPFRTAATGALTQIQAGNAPGGQFTKTFSGLGDLSSDPGYQFRMDQGMRGVDAGAASRGGVLSGATLKAEQQYGQDYASGEYQNAFNRFQSNQTNSFNRLASVAGLGQTAANTTAAAGTAAATAEENAAVGAGNASASGAVGASNAISSGANSLANWYQQQQLLAKLNGTGSSGYTAGGSASSNMPDNIDAGGGWSPSGG